MTMRMKSDYEHLLESSTEARRLLKQEELIIEVSELLAGAIEESGIQRIELAERLGKSKGFVSQVLSGGRNLTLRTVSDLADALGKTISFSLQDEAHGTAADSFDNVVWVPADRKSVV